MDRLHRKPLPKETRTGRDCKFCQNFDSNFEKRDPMDRLIHPDLEDTASAHMTENGHVKHRLLELGLRVGPLGYAA